MPWHVIRRLHGSDTVARTWLVERLKLEIYYPQLRVSKPIARKRLSQAQRRSGRVFHEARLVPLLPGYYFVRLDMEKIDWRRLSELAHVGGMVNIGNLPARIGDDEIRALMAREVRGAIPEAEPARLLYKLGQAVRVTEGPFAGFDAVVAEDVAIARLDSEQRIRIALGLFGRETFIDAPARHLDKP
jgi:transcription antitermination factor NusG